MLCEECLSHGMPKAVHLMLIMPLHKCKGSKLDLNNYRGISLIHPVGKVLAALVLGKLEQHSEEHTCRAAYWAGFCKRHRVEDTVISLSIAYA